MSTAPKAAEPLEPAETVLKFLASVGSSSEAELYLRLFRARARESFATIAVEASAILHGADGVAMDLRFLSALGLTPIVLLGFYDPSAAAAQRDALAELLRHAEVETASLDAAGPYPAVAAAAQRGAIPLLATTNADKSARLAELSRLLAALQSHKLIFVGPLGGISLRGERLEVVNLSTDYAALHTSLELEPRQRELLEDSQRLIFELSPQALLVSIASPLNLLHELFTVKGAGTLLRKGACITRHDGYLAVDVQRLAALLSSSFGRPVDERFFDRPLQHVYVDESYRGAALVLDTPLGGYLSKFAVTREAQGEGIGQDLWGALSVDYPALIWRARSDNPIRAWYERKCQGRFSADPWTIYFRGLSPIQVAAAIELALRQPVDF